MTRRSTKARAALVQARREIDAAARRALLALLLFFLRARLAERQDGYSKADESNQTGVVDMRTYAGDPTIDQLYEKNLTAARGGIRAALARLDGMHHPGTALELQAVEIVLNDARRYVRIARTVVHGARAR